MIRDLIRIFEKNILRVQKYAVTKTTDIFVHKKLLSYINSYFMNFQSFLALKIKAQ